MTTATPEQLREAITEIDSMSQGAFSEISTIAMLTLKSLETPNGCADIESIARVLSAIWAKAKDAENYINCMAEGVACNYKDEAMLRHWDATSKAVALTVNRKA